MKPDKFLHLIAGFLIAFLFWLLTRDFDTFVFAPALAASAIGFFKEGFDVFVGRDFNWFEILATFAGGLYANTIILSL